MQTAMVHFAKCRARFSSLLTVLLIGSFTAGSVPSFAAPAPQPPRQAVEVVVQLQKFYREKDAGILVRISRSDVQTDYNGRRVANDISEWTNWTMSRVAGLDIYIKSSSVNFRSVLAVENISTMGTNTNISQDCCAWNRTTLYELDEEFKIQAVHIIDAGPSAVTFAPPPETSKDFPSARPLRLDN